MFRNHSPCTKKASSQHIHTQFYMLHATCEKPHTSDSAAPYRGSIPADTQLLVLVRSHLFQSLLDLMHHRMQGCSQTSPDPYTIFIYALLGDHM